MSYEPTNHWSWSRDSAGRSPTGNTEASQPSNRGPPEASADFRSGLSSRGIEQLLRDRLIRVHTVRGEVEIAEGLFRFEQLGELLETYRSTVEKPLNFVAVERPEMSQLL